MGPHPTTQPTHPTHPLPNNRKKNMSDSDSDNEDRRGGGGGGGGLDTRERSATYAGSRCLELLGSLRNAKHAGRIKVRPLSLPLYPPTHPPTYSCRP